VEGINSVEESGQPIITDHGGFEILKQSPMLGDGKFKLEIGTKVVLSRRMGCSHALYSAHCCNR